MYVSRKTKLYNKLGTFVLSFWTEVFSLSLSLAQKEIIKYYRFAEAFILT